MRTSYFIHLSAGAFVDVRLCSTESAATSDFLPRLLDICIFSLFACGHRFRFGSRNKNTFTECTGDELFALS